MMNSCAEKAAPSKREQGKKIEMIRGSGRAATPLVDSKQILFHRYPCRPLIMFLPLSFRRSLNEHKQESMAGSPDFAFQTWSQCPSLSALPMLQ